MIRNNPSQMHLFAMPLILALATAGCATRGYARRQVAPVSQKVDTLSAVTDTKFVATNEKIELVAGIHQKDVSQINERISTAEIKLGVASSAAQQAGTDAQRAQADAQRAQTAALSAMSESQENARRLAANSQAAAAAGATDVNYKLLESADVTFGFNKFSLTPEAKTELDQLASKVQSMPRVLVELVGFTDATGPQDYNLNLSRERADTVQRYLVTQKVPLHVIHTVGLGAEAPPSGLETEASSSPSKSEASRRVLIRIFGPAEVVAQASAGGGGQN
jgi:outer membrane protein OmpA-like peptidoglycan-associated protein